MNTILMLYLWILNHMKKNNRSIRQHNKLLINEELYYNTNNMWVSEYTLDICQEWEYPDTYDEDWNEYCFIYGIDEDEYKNYMIGELDVNKLFQDISDD